MSESKMLKAKCKKTGRYYGLELKQFGPEWGVVNMIWLNDAESKVIASEIKQSAFYSNDNLLACKKCGRRKISSCSCLRTSIKCGTNMDYKLDCIYCDQLEIDYSRPTAKGPYTEWAGQSNIPSAIKDRYGNPQGSQYDLAQDGGLKGHGILIMNLCSSYSASVKNVKKALEKKGFDVDVRQGNMLSPRELERKLADVGQMWLISQEETQVTAEHIRVISDFFNRGHGIYIWGDNDPLNGDANAIIGSMFGSKLSGDYYARKVLGIQKKPGEPGIIENHLISTGIVSFFEGDTISKVKMTQDLHPLVYSSDRNVVTAYYEKDGKRALIDGAFTRLWDGDWGTTAGTERYIVNAAAWLANVERFGYYQ